MPGHYFEVSTAGVENLCTGDGTGYAEDYEFRLEVAGNDATVSVGDALFATGTLQGCSLSYSSIVWSDLREGLEIEWQILGSARVDLSGGDGCVGGSVDWEGTETFVVTTSAHPDVEPGCTYTLGVSGAWIEDVGIEDGAPATTSEAP